MRYLLAALCVVLASAVVRLGWAEISARADTSAALERAAAIEGCRNAARLEDLAELAGSDSTRARMLLRQATIANPRRVSAWLALGLRAEGAGDFKQAESALKQAARLDRGYLPAWTLANFYFRRVDREEFWLWAQRAAQMTYDDFRPLFRLCDVFEPDVAAVMNRLVSGKIPSDDDRGGVSAGGEGPGAGSPVGGWPGGGRKMLRAYVTYLAGESRRLDAAEQAAWRLVPMHDPRDWPVFVNLITREIDANRMPQAVALWNAGVVSLGSGPRHAEPLDASKGPVLTNGALEDRPMGEAFDWSMPSCQGLVSEWRPARVVFNLNGSQPDYCVLLDQPIPVASRQGYHLRFESWTQTASPLAAYRDAIRWETAGQTVTTLAPGRSWQSSEGVFRSPGDTFARLRLLCRRMPGTLAFEGRVEIRNVRIEVE